jgi:hypothetical protein
MDGLPIDFDPGRIAAFCRRHRICRLALYGSVLRDDFGPGSDVDVLAEFDPGATIGWDIVDIERELSELLGRSVDLKTPGFVSRHFRDRICREARDLYVAA